MQVLNIHLDTPLKFNRYRCKMCGSEDANWLLMQFLSDGFWRTLTIGKTLREQGLDNKDISRIYCVHECSETLFRDFRTLDEVNVFISILGGE